MVSQYFPVLRDLGSISWVICEAFLYVTDNTFKSFKSVALALLTIYPDFSVTKTSIQGNFDTGAHDFLF